MRVAHPERGPAARAGRGRGRRAGPLNTTRDAPAALLYDGDCAICRVLTAALLVWDRRRRLVPVPLQSSAARELLPGMNEEERLASLHLALGDGRTLSAGAALPALLRLLPGGAPLARIAGISLSATERAYRLVADHRGGLGRLAFGRARRWADRRLRERRAEVSAPPPDGLT